MAQDWETIEDVTREDIIDSRDIIEWLENWDRDDDDYAELGAVLEDVASEGADNLADWEYGEALIRDDYFEDYARELADDIGAVDRNASWPNTFIDWEGAADALKVDYACITIGGVDYWGRM